MCLIITCLIFPTSTYAKDTVKVGKVVQTTGDVKVKKGSGKKQFKAFKNMAFTQGDTIFTGTKSSAVLHVDTDRQVDISADTELVIKELVKSFKARSGKTNLTLSKGKVKVKISKKLNGKSKLDVQTPNAIMGVMGTEFYVYYDENGETWVGVLEGVVTVTLEGSDEPIRLTKNQAIFVRKDGSTEIRELEEEQVRKFTEQSETTTTPPAPIIPIMVDNNNEDNEWQEPIEETPSEEPPREEPPAKEPPVEEPPAEEPPVEEPPAKETPVEEPPVEETHAKETHP